ncbi:hypothetical protein [Marininema halotolerans]|uniref:hypothetical protein n=1 Tax=Marininema halotolerans TaxID=1155944 RepID=UPI000B84AFA8|nr:hypothetical protein [Marininema halotolerans]
MGIILQWFYLCLAIYLVIGYFFFKRLESEIEAFLSEEDHDHETRHLQDKLRMDLLNFFNHIGDNKRAYLILSTFFMMMWPYLLLMHYIDRWKNH